MHSILFTGDPNVPSGAFLCLLEAAGRSVFVPETIDAAFLYAAEHGDGLSIIGAGKGCVTAILLAARYPVRQLILIDCPAPSRTLRRALNRLFAVLADTLVLQPEISAAAPRHVARILRGVRTSRSEGRVLAGCTSEKMWTECEHLLFEAVADFSNADSSSPMLAGTGKA